MERVLSLLDLKVLSSQSALIVSDNLPHLKRSTLRDFFLKILQGAEDLFKEASFIALTRLTILKSGLLSSSQPTAQQSSERQRDLLFINEANNSSYEAFRQLSIRTSKEIFIDYLHPTCEFWTHTELLRRKQVESGI
ncbi:hypothetical protein [Bacteroidetes bacterium endosymbiont of Geopemphigus sp.]|uniref:hypothetical protein n=1 Tax=Bacteroidetes bacterium endosymbiont of Geopemphigus sp. TaxID=2047937 RepID=UPI000CD0A738|nr:hypothetical protein [Bacteroidetes bacterium endosymbiont of Geopemphigus sp.]